MIKFDKLSLKNFFSHVDTSIDLKEYKGLVLIEGQNHEGHYSSNGSGKSTLLEGIVYALTGETLRGVSVNDVINRNYKKNTGTTLQFLKDDTLYKISRYRKDDVYGDSIVLHKGEENISKRVNKESQKLIDDVLDISYKILVSTMLLGEGLSSKFTQLSDPEKKSLIESTLNLKYDLGKIRESANTRLKELKLQSANIGGEISALKGFSEINISDLEKSIADHLNCIEIYEETISQLMIEYNSLDLESYNPKISLINNTITTINTLERDREIKANEFHRKNAEMQEVLSTPTPVCLLCHQALTTNSAKTTVVNKYNSELEILYKEIESIDLELSKMPERSVLQSKLDALNAEYTEKFNRYRDIGQDINKYEVKMAESKRDIEYAKSSIASAKDCTSRIEEKEKLLSHIEKEIAKYEYFYSLFSPTGIIVNILADAIEYINGRLEIYSEVLLEKDYKINFLKGKISLVDSKGSSYQSLSNGEKRRLDIAIQFSLHDYCMKYCGTGIDTMFIDEILDTLDDVGIENILTVLRMKLEYCNLSRIFVISHNSELKSYFDKVVTVVKDEKGDSYLLN